MSDHQRRDQIIFRFLAFTGVFLTISLLLFLMGAGNWPVFALFAFPGAFLYKSFLFMAFFIPIYLGLLCVVLQTPEFRRGLLWPLNLAFLPVMTFSLVLRIGLDEEPNGASALFVETFGKGGAVMFLSVLSLFLGALVGILALKMAQDGPSFFQNFTRFWADVVQDPLAKKPQSQALQLEHGPNWKRTEFVHISEDLRNDPFYRDDLKPAEKAAPEVRVESPSFPAPQVPAYETPEVGSPEVFEPAVQAEIQDFEGSMEARQPQTQSFYEKAQAIREKNPIVNWDELKPEDSDMEEEDLADAAALEEEDEDIAAFESELDERLKKELGYQAMVEKIFQAPEETVVFPVSKNADSEEAFVEEEAFEPEAQESEADDSWSALDQTLRSGQLSAQVRPLEGGNFPVKTRIVRPADQSESPEAPRPFVSGGRRASFANYSVPVEGILTKYKEESFSEIDEDTRRSAHVLKMTLKEFNIDADVTGIRKGPVVTMFEILPAAGVKLSKIAGLSDNIALGLAATSVRIVAPIPGKHAVGIEVPNKDRRIIGFSEMVRSAEFTQTKAEIPIILGKDISGDAQIIDLAKTPHLLIAGATGSGKSVCVNSLVTSILYSRSPEDVRLLMVDPKIVELKFFNDIPHLLAPVITEPKKALQAVQWCLYEMERRYALLDAIGAKDIKSYNAKIAKRNLATTKLPYIVFVVDEFADLMATSGKDLEGTLARLAAMSRAVGIHLVLATQRPSIDVITGLIKANFPSRIAFMVASKTDSRIILDSMGAEKLLGKGDMLFTSSWNPFPSRIQGSFLSEEDVEKVVDHVKTLGEPDYISEEIFFDDEEDGEKDSFDADEMDPLFEKAVEIVRSQKKASASFLQRRLGVGYNRAARMVECMEEMGIVGPQNGSKPRDIIHSV